MTVYDFSSGFNLLNQGINSLGEALNNRTNAQGYSGIGQAVQSGDWDGAAARAWSMGNPDLAMKLWQQGYAMRGAGGYPTTTDGTAAPASLTPTTVPTDGKPAAPGAPSVTAGPATGASGPRAEATANPFTNTLINAESRGDAKIVSNTDKDSHGLTLAQGGNPTEISQGLFQIQNHPGGTWSIYAPKAGVDLARYPTPASAPPDVQHAVAQQIPIGQWGPRTIQILRQKFGDFDPHMTLGQVEARFGPAAATAATGGGQPSAAATAAPPAATAAPAATPAAQPAAPGTAAAAPGAGGAPASPQMAQATPLPPPAPIPPAAAAALPAARPAMPAVPAGGMPTAQAYAGIPLNAPEQGVDAAARALATNLPGAPSPQQQAAAAANPPGLGDLFRLLTGQPNAPAAPQPPAPGASPGANIPAAYGQPQPPTPPAPAGPAAQLQPIVQALQSGRVTMRELLANPQAYGLPDPRTAQGQPVWQVLAQAANSTGRPAGLGPPTAAMGAQAFGGANATATSTGNAPLPPARPSDFGRPPAELSTSGPGFGEGQDPTSAIAAATGAGRAYRPAGSQTTEEAPLPPVRPPDIGKPFPVAKAPASSPVPAAILPKSSRVPTPQGPFGPPQPGDAFSRDFGPGAGQMWGPSGGVMAAGRGGITPAYLGGPPPQGVTPQAIAAARNAFMQPGAGAVPAGLPPRGAPAPGGGGALGGALAGLGGGLLNMLSATPPQGVPGMNTPAQYLQGGQGAPLPAPPWLAQRPQGQAPGVLPSGLPGVQGAGPQPGVGAQPAAQPGAPGAPAAAPAAPVDPVDAQIAQLTARMQQMRSIAVARSPLGEAYAKPFEDEANRVQEQINELTRQKVAAGYKTSETTKSTQDEMAKEGLKNISTAYGGLSDPGGPKGLLSNVYQMKADLDAGAIQGWGGAQGMVQHLAETLAAFDLVSSGKVANTQQIQDLAPQETMRLARMLVGKNRLTNKDIALLQQGQLNLGQRPEVVRGMLDMAAKMATDQIDTHNTAVDRFAEANPAYGNAAKIQYKFDKSTLPKPEDFKAVGGQSGGALKAPNADTLKDARAQIAAGKPKADVENFMRLHGYDPSGL